MPKLKYFLILPALAAALAMPARAQAQVAAENAWSRATPPGAGVGAIYLTLASPADDTLTGVSSPAASAAQVHEMAMDGAVMRMRELSTGLALPAGQKVSLQPGGYHIMLVGLKAPLKQGETVPVHLTFAKSAPLDITVPVSALGAAKAPATTGGTKTP